MCNLAIVTADLVCAPEQLPQALSQAICKAKQVEGMAELPVAEESCRCERFVDLFGKPWEVHRSRFGDGRGEAFFQGTKRRIS